MIIARLDDVVCSLNFYLNETLSKLLNVENVIQYSTIQ